MQSLGLSRVASILNELHKERRSGQSTIAKNKNNNGEESGSQYDPHEDEGDEADEGGHVLVEVLKEDGRISSRTKVKVLTLLLVTIGGARCHLYIMAFNVTLP